MKEKTPQLDEKRQNLVFILATRRAPRVHFLQKKTLKKVELTKIAFEIPERKFLRCFKELVEKM